MAAGFWKWSICATCLKTSPARKEIRPPCICIVKWKTSPKKTVRTMDAWIVPGHGEVLNQLSVGKYQNTQVNRKLTSFEGLPNKHNIVTLNTPGLLKN